MRNVSEAAQLGIRLLADWAAESQAAASRWSELTAVPSDKVSAPTYLRLPSRCRENHQAENDKNRDAPQYQTPAKIAA